MSRISTPKLILNQVSINEKLVHWLSASPDDVILDFDSDLSTDSELHFDAYDADSNDGVDEGTFVAPEITKRMWDDTTDFGAMYTFQMKADRLHIIVRAPSEKQSVLLWQKFQQQRSVLMARTWNIYVTVCGLVFFFLLFCFSTAKLHNHWHRYEEPHSTMFDAAFQIFIWVGDGLIKSTEKIW